MDLHTRKRRLMVGLTGMGLIAPAMAVAQTTVAMDGYGVATNSSTQQSDIRVSTAFSAGLCKVETVVTDGHHAEALFWHWPKTDEGADRPGYFRIAKAHVSPTDVQVPDTLSLMENASSITFSPVRTEIAKFGDLEKANSFIWREWEISVPRMLYKANSRAVADVMVFVDAGETTLHADKYSFYVKEDKGTQKAGDVKEQLYIRRNDLRLWQNDRFNSPLSHVLASSPLPSTITVNIIPDGDVSQRVLLTYNMSDLTKTMSRANKIIPVVEDKYRKHECDPYSQQGGGCFLTTATCEMMQLADDCWELRTLRKFRDSYMVASADGRSDIETYYRTAPGIVAAIAKRSDRDAILSQLYARYIVPSAIMARMGLNRAAHSRYRAMMRFVEERIA